MIETLKKVLRRTERDVAFAGVMLGSVAAMSKLFPVMEKWCELTVHFYGGHDMSWIAVPWEHDFAAWRDFQKWYHGRPQSDCYVMWFKSGHQMFRRVDIRAYSIRWGERVKKETAE